MAGDQPESGDERTFVWVPGQVVTTMWVALAILLGLLTLMFLGMVYSLLGATDEALQFDWIAVAVLTFAVLTFHQLIHALIARIIGAHPRFDFDVIQWVLPVMYCRPGDHCFSRGQYLLYSLAPLGILSGIGIMVMPFEAHSAWLIVPLALNASLSIRDIWSAWIVWRLPAGAEIRVEKDALRVFLPI